MDTFNRLIRKVPPPESTPFVDEDCEMNFGPLIRYLQGLLCLFMFNFKIKQFLIHKVFMQIFKGAS